MRRVLRLTWRGLDRLLIGVFLAWTAICAGFIVAMAMQPWLSVEDIAGMVSISMTWLATDSVIFVAAYFSAEKDEWLAEFRSKR